MLVKIRGRMIKIPDKINNDEISRIFKVNSNTYIIDLKTQNVNIIKQLIEGKYEISVIELPEEKLRTLKIVYPNENSDTIGTNDNTDNTTEVSDHTIFIKLRNKVRSDGSVISYDMVLYSDTGEIIYRKIYGVGSDKENYEDYPVLVHPLKILDIIENENFGIVFHVRVADIDLIGSYNDIVNNVLNLPVYVGDKRVVEQIIRSILSKEYEYYMTNGLIRKLYSTIGLVRNDNTFTVVYPQYNNTIPVSDEQSVIFRKIGLLEINDEKSFLNKYFKYLEEHKWGQIRILTLLSYITISPFLYNIENIDVRPDMVIIGTHGTMKTRTTSIVTGRFYGVNIENGDFVTSVSRLSDLLTSTTIPQIIDEIEKINDVNVFSVLKSRTTTNVDFVRKRIDQTQRRLSYTTPLILISNTGSILSDQNYIFGRTVILDTGMFTKLEIKSMTPSDEYYDLIMDNRIFGPKFLNYITKKYTYSNIIQRIKNDSKEILKEYDGNIIDVRRATIYSLLGTGLDFINDYIKNKGIGTNIFDNIDDIKHKMIILQENQLRLIKKQEEKKSNREQSFKFV